MCRRTSVSRCLVLIAFGITLAAPAAMAGGNGIEMSGSVAGSYFYNTNSPDNGLNSDGGGQPFHPSHNEFQLDEAVIDLSKAATDESRVGFRIRTAFGELGDIMGAAGGGGNGIWLADAYIDYMCGCGMNVQLGKFQTHIGYETAFAGENVNITRGFTYNRTQPIDQIGLRLSHNVGGIDVMVGAVNGFTANQPDVDDEVDLIWSLGLGTDMMSASINGEADFADENDAGAPIAGDTKGLTLDGIISLMPSDTFSAWLDVTYNVEFVDGAPDPEALGVAVGSHLALNDKIGVAGRFEWINLDSGPTDFDLIAITGTLDYMLVENLVAKLEVKWDHSPDSDLYDGGSEDNQVLLGTQLVYTF